MSVIGQKVKCSQHIWSTSFQEVFSFLCSNVDTAPLGSFGELLGLLAGNKANLTVKLSHDGCNSQNSTANGMEEVLLGCLLAKADKIWRSCNNAVFLFVLSQIQYVTVSLNVLYLKKKTTTSLTHSRDLQFGLSWAEYFEIQPCSFLCLQSAVDLWWYWSIMVQQGWQLLSV